ncbi:hypothetical protein C4D60_Mb06t04720 [Musa balbisiana]|uniref:Uncharacterized protein n=1 Tax=Musa balbisiana TaxID=52838 RepID=A0A4S8ILC2_MUSBA|nr:hypothetical protein C4D60_Mb06t04720 [Musa balbisiana]
MIPSSPSFGIALEVGTLENSHGLTENSEMLTKMLERDDVKDVSLGSLRVIWCIQTIHSASFTQIAWMMRQSAVEGNEFHIHSVKPKLTAVQMEEGEEKNEAYGDGGGRKSGRSHGHGRRCIREKLTQVTLALVARSRHGHHAQEHRSGHHSSREPRHQLSRRSGEGGHKESTPTTKPIYKTPTSILSSSLLSPAKGETTTQRYHRTVLMEMGKIACAVLVAAVSATTALAAEAPAPGPASASFAVAPAVGAVIGASLLSLFAFCLQ